MLNKYALPSTSLPEVSKTLLVSSKDLSFSAVLQGLKFFWCPPRTYAWAFLNQRFAMSRPCSFKCGSRNWQQPYFLKLICGLASLTASNHLQYLTLHSSAAAASWWYCVWTSSISRSHSILETTGIFAGNWVSPTLLYGNLQASVSAFVDHIKNLQWSSLLWWLELKAGWCIQEGFQKTGNTANAGKGSMYQRSTRVNTYTQWCTSSSQAVHKQFTSLRTIISTI